MSDLTVEMHTMQCDYPGCSKHASNDDYSCFGDYEEAVDQFTNGYDETGWWHAASDRDYCPKHWHWDEETDEQVVGPKEVQR